MASGRAEREERSVFDRWWPSTQSLDLIEGSSDAVAAAAVDQFREVARFTGNAIRSEWRTFEGLDEAFSSVALFDNVGSTLLLLPTRSKWFVLWTNHFLCDGFDHFLRGITIGAGLTTVHWSAHDTTTTFQPGARFHQRRLLGGELVERVVQVARTDRRWDFFERGEPLPEEDTDGYRARRKRDRLNERRLMELLARLDARPWDAAWYALPEQRVLRLERPSPPTAIRREPDDVITGEHGPTGEGVR